MLTPEAQKRFAIMAVPHRTVPSLFSTVFMAFIGFVFAAGGGLFGFISAFNSGDQVAIWLPVTFSAIGIIVMIASVVSYDRAKRRTQVIADLVTHGIKTTATITRFNTQRSSDSNAATITSVQFICEGKDIITQQPRRYKTDWIGGNVLYALSTYQSNPISVDVFVNPQDPKNYYVDITTIPYAPPANDTPSTTDGTPPTLAV